jgi:hypothetical protein
MAPALLVTAAGTLTVVGQLAAGRAPSPRIFLGVAIAGAGMLGLAQAAPDAATQLATVVLITALLTSGYDVSRGIGNALNR